MANKTNISWCGYKRASSTLATKGVSYKLKYLTIN